MTSRRGKRARQSRGAGPYLCEPSLARQVGFRVRDDDKDEAVQLLSYLTADNPELSEQEILKLFNDEIKDDEKVRRAVIQYFFRRMRAN